VTEWGRAVFLTVVAALFVFGCSSERDKPAKEQKPVASASAQFVEGNLFFLAYHELGHALISEYRLPVAGREEDAADRAAIWMMTPQSAAEEPDYLTAAMQGWFSSASNTPLDNIAWWDDHGTDQQRGYQIACLLLGSDTTRFKPLADSIGLPAERQDTCAAEAAQNDATWDQLLRPHIRAQNEGASYQDATISHAPTKEYTAEREYLQQIGLLEHLQELITQDYRVEPGIRIVAEECGEANSFWNADDRKLTICYELVSDYQARARE
jgi:Putative metallopeptidase